MYESYICLTKETLGMGIPNELMGQFGYEEIEIDQETGNQISSTKIHPTWEQLIKNGKLGNPTHSIDGNLTIIKGTFSHLTGEMSAILALGLNMEYPNNSILTSKEAQILVKSDRFSDIL